MMPDTWHLGVGWVVTILIFWNAHTELGPFFAAVILFVAWLVDLLLFPNYGDRP